MIDKPFAESHCALMQPPPLAQEQRRVFLGVPHSGTLFTDSLSSVVSSSLGRHDVRIGAAASSLLCFNFNRLWADALNYSPRPDFFAMHHSDIWAPDGWVD